MVVGRRRHLVFLSHAGISLPGSLPASDGHRPAYASRAAIVVLLRRSCRLLSLRCPVPCRLAGGSRFANASAGTLSGTAFGALSAIEVKFILADDHGRGQCDEQSPRLVFSALHTHQALAFHE